MFRRWIILAGPLYLSLWLYGCVPLVVVGAGGLAAGGTAVWLDHKLTQDLPASYDKVIEASKKALASLKLDVEKETKTDDVVQIISQYHDGKTIWIDIHKLSSEQTSIAIRVGVVGDKELSREILEKIQSYL